MTQVDVAVIGAGAAGIGAARRLAGSGRDVLLLEADARVGGRALTVRRDALTLDLGCGWLHSATRNPWVAIAEHGGHPVDRTPSAWGRQFRNLGFSAQEQADARAAYAAFAERLRDSPPASDRAADALEPGLWNGFIESLSGYINGVGLAGLSVADYLAYDDAAIEADWRLPDGYGTLVAASLPPIPLRLATPVQRIEADRAALRLVTPHGSIQARTAIVTVSTAVLASGRLALPPALDDRCQAASRLPLGLADKLFLRTDDPDALDPDSHLLGNPRSGCTGSYYLRPFGQPVVECFLGGAGAIAQEDAGLDGAAEFAKAELGALLGSRFASGLRLVAGSAWRRERFIGGSYSHALPGHAAARRVLAEPWHDRIFFAGEACSPTDFSTAHGALATGEAAADAALASLG